MHGEDGYQSGGVNYYVDASYYVTNSAESVRKMQDRRE